MNTALNTSKYILKYCQENNISDCSNKKLQKLLYYVQAWFLVYANKAVFSENIEAWLHGAVVPEIYREYKSYGFTPIKIDASNTEINLFENKKDMDLINSILHLYCKHDADYLEMRNHMETPWQEARLTNDKIITHKSMKDYYQSVLDNYKPEPENVPK